MPRKWRSAASMLLALSKSLEGDYKGSISELTALLEDQQGIERQTVLTPELLSYTAAFNLAGIYRFVGRVWLPEKTQLVVVVTYCVAILMVSSVPYITGKQLKLNKRQPIWALLAGVLLLNLAIASYQLVVFAIAFTYVLSGPALWLYRAVNARRGGTGSGSAGGRKSGPPPAAAAGA